MHTDLTPDLTWSLGLGGGALLIGLLLLWAARRSDRRNWFIERATPLSLVLATPGDDVWLNAACRCETPLASPHFNTPCLYYRYRLEEQVTRTERDSKGQARTTTRWETRKTETHAADCVLHEAEQQLTVSGAEAEFYDLDRQTDTQGQWRHSQSVFPVVHHVNAVGTVADDGRLVKSGDIPLLITRLDRETFIAHAERTEAFERRGGFLAFWLGTSAFAYGALAHWHGLALQPVTVSHAVPVLALCGVLGALPCGILWLIYLYNTLVVYRAQVDNAWRLIDIDLKNRYDLIPNLVEVAGAYREYERTLLTELSALRTQALQSTDRARRMGADDRMEQSVDRLLAVYETTPQLKANAVLQKLFDALVALETKIAHNRAFFNDSALEYNNARERFPNKLVSSLFGFRACPYFTFAAADKDLAPPVKG